MKTSAKWINVYYKYLLGDSCQLQKRRWCCGLQGSRGSDGTVEADISQCPALKYHCVLLYRHTEQSCLHPTDEMSDRWLIFWHNAWETPSETIQFCEMSIVNNSNHYCLPHTQKIYIYCDIIWGFLRLMMTFVLYWLE